MRCKECGKTLRTPRRELRDVQLCGGCYKIRKHRKEHKSDTDIEIELEQPVEVNYEPTIEYEERDWKELIQTCANLIREKKTSSKKFKKLADIFFTDYNDVSPSEILYDYSIIYTKLTMPGNSKSNTTVSLSDYYDGGGKFGRDRFDFLGNSSIDFFELSLVNDIVEISKFKLTSVPDNSISSRIIDDEKSIQSHCEDLISQHKSKYSLVSDHNIELIEDLIDAYKEFGSLQKISKEIGVDVTLLRRDFKNLIRIPKQLKELVDSNKISSDPILAGAIAIYVTDYFNWDQEKSKVPQVLSLAKDMAETIRSNLDLRREFFATKDDFSKPVSHSSAKNNEIQSIYEDWPVKESKFEFDRFRDRTGKQYRFIVFYSKVVDAVRFLRRWEYEKGRRIPKAWASQMIAEIKQNGNVKEFLEEHENEFRD